MKRLLTVNDLADFLGVPITTLYQWRTRKYGPKGKRVGRYVRYQEKDVLAWLDTMDEEQVR